MKLYLGFILAFWILFVACRGNVVSRTESGFHKVLKQRHQVFSAGSSKQLNAITAAVKKIQNELQRDQDGKERRSSNRAMLNDAKKNAAETKKNLSKWSNMNNGLGEKLLDTAVQLLSRQLEGRDEKHYNEKENSKRNYNSKLEKRVDPVSAQMAAKAGEKGIEMTGKIAEKQMENMEKQQQKSDKFLGEEIKLDITGDKGWQTDDLFIPPGYHMNAKIEPESKPAPTVNGQPPFTFPFGAGGLIMNGCFGSGYKPGDRCYDATWATTICLDLIPGATFIGVGFDGRGDYSPESSRMDLVQRACARKQRYNGKMIPDTMKLLGVYDTSANMQVFYSRSEYQKYLEQQSGASGSGFGFYGGVKKAWGSSTTEGAQKYLAVFDIDVDRYEIFMDVVKPDNLNVGFLREFMMLPTSYYTTGAAIKFQDFIQRFGTHYIKAGRFGGQLEIRKSMEASQVSSKEEFSEVMEFEFKTFFASAGARSSDKEGERSRAQKKTSSTSMSVQGGNQEIASIISDVYAPTFKSEFKQWLKSIPQFPKAFKFTISPITDLLNFRPSDLFPDSAPSFGCETHRAELKRDPSTNKFYYNSTVNGTVVKEFCEYLSREALEYSIQQRRTSLKRAIDVYMEEGSISVSEMNLPAGTSGCQTQNYKYQVKAGRPSWKEMTAHNTPFKTIFKMDDDLTGSYHGKVNIPKDLECLVRFIDGEWVVSKDDDKFDFFSGCNRGGSRDIYSDQHYICIYGLLLKYDERMGALNLDRHGFNISQQTFPSLHPNLIGGELARVEWPSDHIFQMSEVVGYLPCNVKWSNALRFDPSEEGRCLHFTASTKGTVFVIFSAIPKDKDTWYYVQISPYGVGIFKSQALKVSSVDVDAVGLGDEIMYQPYFVCVKQENDATVIEYGKTQGTTEHGEIFLSMIDKEKPLHVRFYAFGNGEDDLEVTDAHVLKRSLTKAKCKGDTEKDEETNICVQKCNGMCDPLKGCRRTSSGNPLPTDCNACLYFKRVDNGECVEECPQGFKQKDKTCVSKGCQKNTCMNGGTCTELGDEKYQCHCSKDYTGDHCELTANPCEPNPCKNGGHCTKELSTRERFKCSCKKSYVGETCEIEKCPEGWKNFIDSCYLFPDYDHVTFLEAEEACKDHDAQLVVVDSEEENKIVRGLIKDKIIWLGIKRELDLPSTWRQLNGNRVNFNKIPEEEARRFIANYYSHYGPHNFEICAVMTEHWREEWRLIPCTMGDAEIMCERSAKN
ncbi:uncharacterized protein [Montipora capricornis]|uniref:uncharacterized protein n=1 Tax=Montipora capricornis TaxID=246305 RepID=UPI0035F12FB8